MVAFWCKKMVCYTPIEPMGYIPKRRPYMGINIYTLGLTNLTKW